MTSIPGSILIVAVNARHSHASHSARCLMAARGGEGVELLETDLDANPFQLAGDILGRKPGGVAFSVYLWNAPLVLGTLRILREVAPALRMLVGGPEITCDDRRWDDLAETVIGEGEAAFANWVEKVAGASCSRGNDVGAGCSPHYSETDLAHRTVYVESSRGCPFSCAYCSSCNTGLRLFPIEAVARELDALIQRGVRAFRFLDRSFNADEAHACRVLDLLLQREPGRFPVHLEFYPRRLGPAFRERLCAFPPGALHIEAGVQTLNPVVASRVGRRANVDEALETLRFLQNDAAATLHADLIFGLPGEDLESFAAGFDRLVREVAPRETQVNLLKILPGTPLRRDAATLGLRHNPAPPYEVLSSDVLSFADLTRLQRFARCWEVTHNRQKFPDVCAALLARPSPFAAFDGLAAFIHNREGRLHALSAARWQALAEAFSSL